MLALTKFGARCRELRNQKKMTMYDQAQFFGCAVSEISSIETGDAKPTIDYPRMLAKWLHLSPDDEQELIALATSRSNILRFRSTSENDGVITRKLFRKINKLSPQEIRRIGKTSHRKPPDD